MVPDGDDVRDAVLDALPGLKRGAVVDRHELVGSRPAPWPWERCSKPTGSHMVDAPVSGARFKAKDGTLAIMAGGDRKAFQQGPARAEDDGNQIFHSARSAPATRSRR